MGESVTRLEERIRILEAEKAQLQQENIQLQKGLERLELVLDGAQLGIWDWNVQTNDVVFNKRWKSMLGYEEQELANELDTWTKVLCPDDAEYVYGVLNQHLEGKIPVYATEHRVKHKDGHWVWILDIGCVVEWDDEGKPLRATGIHQDISRRKGLEFELKEAVDKAKAASQAKSMFLANMSHEIRTPMAGILGAGRLILESCLDEEQKELAEMMVTSTENLLDILNDILDLNKIEANKLDIEHIPMQPAEVLANVVQLFQQKADEKGLRIELDVAPDMPNWVLGDPTRIRQIALNLLGNALKFTHRGTVRIRLEPNGDSLAAMSVEDTGIGMTEDQLEHIFEHFQQADSSTCRKYGGTGLGTTISKRLAELMGGHIEVQSEKGIGSCFTVTFEAEPTPAPPEVETINLERDYNKTVILAEDNLINRKIAQKILSGLGIQTIVANHGKDVIEHISQPHHLILMDSQMPIMDGLAATRALRKQGYSRPIVALSANVFRDDQENYRAAGMDGFIPKPFSKQQLVETLDTFLVAS